MSKITNKQDIDFSQVHVHTEGLGDFVTYDNTVPCSTPFPCRSFSVISKRISENAGQFQTFASEVQIMQVYFRH